MAKSLKSHFKRKIRAISRVKKAPKEAEKLNKVLKCREEFEKKTKEESIIAAQNAPGTDEPSNMDLSSEKVVSTLNLKTMKKADGTYPSWLNQKQKNKLARAAKLQKRAKKQKQSLRR